MSEKVDFLVNRKQFDQTQFHTTPLPTLEAGQLLLNVDKFGFTANNITYVMLGDSPFNYWGFFPTLEGWGIVPVWGFADVVDSRNNDIAVGERLYGYFPMSSHLVVQADKVRSGSFMDVASHRQALSPIYNQYTRCAQDPSYIPAYEGLQMLLRPLFMTAFLLDDFFFDNNLFGANTLILSSASSKTALSMAYLLHAQKESRQPYNVVGLTSTKNVSFVEGTGWYDTVLSYDDFYSNNALDTSQTAVSVDFAGNGRLLRHLHQQFGDNLRQSSLVGVTHWGQRGGNRDLPGPEPTLFFAPAQAQKRAQEWGPQGIQQRVGTIWQPYLTQVNSWLTVTEQTGQTAVSTIYQDTLNNNIDPSQGNILSLMN